MTTIYDPVSSGGLGMAKPATPSANPAFQSEAAPITNAAGFPTGSGVATGQFNPNDATVGSGKFGQPYISNPVQTQSLTTLSSDKTKDIAAANTKLAELSNKGISTDSNTGVSTYADGTVYDTKVADTKAEDDAIEANFKKMQENADAVTSAQIASIQQKYSMLKQQQQQVNESTLGATRNALITSGAARYDVYSDDAIKLRLDQNAQKIADLDAEENDLINSAKAAQLSGNNKMLEARNAEIELKRKEKQDAAAALNKELIALNKEAQKAKVAAQKDNAISSLYSSGVTDVPTMLATLRKAGYTDITSKDVADTIKNVTPAGLDDVIKTARTNGSTSRSYSSDTSITRCSYCISGSRFLRSRRLRNCRRVQLLQGSG
jgi:hypothetical protein